MVFRPRTLDFEKSPYTGLTRESWIEAGEYLLEGIFQNIDSFDDPVVKNTQKVKEVKWFLRNEGVENVPVHSVVVFTGKRIRFSKHIRGLITADELASYLVDLNKDRFLSHKEIREVVKLIKTKQE